MDQNDASYQHALAFHGHKCPAMPIGLRAGRLALERLCVERARDKELRVEAETGVGHAMGCFLDGVMSATGCTYGKGNVRKLGWHKLAFTLIETASGRAVRIAVRPEAIEAGLAGPFVALRKQGIAPQDISPDVVDPLVDRVLSRDALEFLDVGEPVHVEVAKTHPTFGVMRCSRCREAVFLGGVRLDAEGRTLCIPCSGHTSASGGTSP